MPIERDIQGRTQFVKLQHARTLKFRDAARLLSTLTRLPYRWTHDEGVAMLEVMEQTLARVREDFENSPNWQRERLPRGTAGIKMIAE